MSLHFETLRIKEVKPETDDCVSVVFDIPESLQPAFAYQSGQHLTIKKIINGADLRRNYSLCSAPHENEWRVAIKKMEYGAFSTWANEHLKTGDSLEVMPPAGNFVIKNKEAKRYVGIAAGSGITPVLSIMKTVLAEQPQSYFTLLYGNKTRHSIIFKEAIEALKNKFMHRLQLVHILSREKTLTPVNQGRIDAAKCQSLFNGLLPQDADAYYICGPEEMIFSVRDFLEGKGIEKNKIHFELFTTQAPTKKQVSDKKQNPEGPASEITIQLDGRSFSFKLPFDSENILDAALKQGADLPFACKGGVCCTCKAKLMSGEVEMDVNYGLEHEEVEQGFILTCQSHPLTEKVVIDFDVK